MTTRNTARKPTQLRAKERGLALLVVLWIIVSAALLVSAFNASVRSGVSLAGAEVQLAQTEALLDAGVEIAVSRLIDEEKGRQWPPDGKTRAVAFEGSELSISVTDANGRIDLNKAERDLLLRFLRQFVGSEVAAGRLRDRIVQARGKPDTAQNPPPFLDIAQLRTLPGMSAQLYAQLAPLITVYSRDGRINPLAAPDEVLSAIPNLTHADIERLRSAERRGEEDDGIAEIRRRAGAYLADEPGPAYVVSVELARPGLPGRFGRAYIVVIGLDANAPYRLIAKRPMVSSPTSRANAG